MARRFASVNSGAVSLDGISRSKKESISAWSVIHQRGKNVVSVSSGNTTSSQPMRLASRRCAISRSTTSRREWLRWMGPICAAPTVRKRDRSPSGGNYPRRGGKVHAFGGRVLGAGALDVVGELRRAERAALEEIAHRIGSDLGLLGLGMGAMVLALAPGPVTQRLGAGI